MALDRKTLRAVETLINAVYASAADEGNAQARHTLRRILSHLADRLENGNAPSAA